MRGFWSRMWRSPTRATLVGTFLSILIASVLYYFNWHTFYDTRKNMEVSKAVLVSKDISALAIATEAAPGKDDRFREVLVRYFEPRPQYIEVSRLNGDSTMWTEKSEALVDTSRTLTEETFTLAVGAGPDNTTPLLVHFKMGVRPLFVVALARAWSFSFFDYMDDSENWWSDALYNRSIPLYGYLLTIIFVGFGTIRAIYKDQQELIRLEQETSEISSELDSFRELHSHEIAAVRQQISRTQEQRDEAVQHREELTAEIATIEWEYQTLIAESPAEQQDDVRIQQAEHRKTEVSLALSAYNEKIALFENKLHETRIELGAAEQLLNEVEERREGLSTKLKDRNREIRTLKKLIRKKERQTSRVDDQQPGKTHSRLLRDWEESQGTIEEQLSQWIKSGRQIRSNFSKHCKAVIVEQQFQKIDPAFVNRFFTHVNNLEYERGARRLIRVVTDTSDDSEITAGKLIIAIDDDLGRTLGMRFETKKDSPGPIFVGFVLALLLRAKCKSFRNFAIRTR